jgi:hypothetical protein
MKSFQPLVISRLKIMLLTILALAFVSSSLAQVPALVQTNFDVMLKAVKDGVYGSFTSAGSPEFKTTYTQESFNIVKEASAPRLAQGYEATYLSSLNLKGYTVFLWKLTYSDGGDDSLVTVSVENGFVIGFLIQ